MEKVPHLKKIFLGVSAAPGVFAFVGLLLYYESKASLGPGPLPVEAALRAQAFSKSSGLSGS